MPSQSPSLGGTALEKRMALEESSLLHIRNWNYAAGLAAGLSLLGFPLVGFIVAGALFGEKGTSILFEPLALVFLIIGVCSLYVAARTPVYWIKIGNDYLIYRKLFQTRRVPWTEVKSVTFEQEVSNLNSSYGFSIPIGYHQIATIRLLHGPRLKIKVIKEDEAAVRELLKHVASRAA